MTRIEPEVMAQIRALSEENARLREDLLRLTHKLDTNNANLVKRIELDMTMLRDICTRATNTVNRFDGRMEDFDSQRERWKTDFEWWKGHLERLSQTVEKATKEMLDAEAQRQKDSLSFRQWAVEKISQIGRIYRR